MSEAAPTPHPKRLRSAPLGRPFEDTRASVYRDSGMRPSDFGALCEAHGFAPSGFASTLPADLDPLDNGACSAASGAADTAWQASRPAPGAVETGLPGVWLDVGRTIICAIGWRVGFGPVELQAPWEQGVDILLPLEPASPQPGGATRPSSARRATVRRRATPPDQRLRSTIEQLMSLRWWSGRGGDAHPGRLAEGSAARP